MVVDALSDGPPLAVLVHALTGRSAVLRNSAGLAEAPADARAALQLARQLGYATGEAMALTEHSIISSYTEDGERAIEWARQAQRIDRDLMPGWSARKTASVLPYVMTMSGHLDGVLDLCAEALAQSRVAGDLIDQADILYLMAVLARQAGRLAEAGPPLREAVDLATHVGYRMRLIDTLDEAGYWCAAARRHVAAVTLWSARSAQGQATGINDTPIELRDRERPLHEARQALDAQHVRAAEDRGAAMTLAAAVEFAVMMMGEDVPPPVATPGPKKFSARERELITLVARGQTDAQIAEALVISVSTVRTHLDRIRDKSGCRRRADLTRLALEEGMI